jgi:GH15 family glucan-1,4-alpha-glucosidase
MSAEKCRPIEFPPINAHGLIGDRRTGALVAADGTLNWFCVPDFDGTPIFGSLLDPEAGGFCRFGPQRTQLGRQRYLSESAAVVTTWQQGTRDNSVELTDLMAWPASRREPLVLGSRLIIRRLRAGAAEELSFEVSPRWGFRKPACEIVKMEDGAVFSFGEGQLSTWTSFPLEIESDRARAVVRANDTELWAVIGWNLPLDDWTVTRTIRLFVDTLQYWKKWSESLSLAPSSSEGRLRRSAITVHLLTHADHDCPVAALTTSLPERRGGDRNYDYRFAWVRDASLSFALLARLGKVNEVKRYLDWLGGLDSGTGSPLQVCYRLNGTTQLAEIEVSSARGYADSRPVRYGNRAAKQTQLGSLAFFADCARIYVEHGGEWQSHHWDLLKRAADYIASHWHLTDNGIWELSIETHHVASKVLSWVVLERATRIAKWTGFGEHEELARWVAVGEAIHAEVMAKGWSEKSNSFVQRYDATALDAAVLLIPLMEFLPPGHPRVAGTVAAIERHLMINGLIYRFEPCETFDCEQLPIGQFEAAFLPATFWYAHTLAKCGRMEEAEAVLKRCEAIAGELGLFAEGADPREKIFLGNTPLLFAQVEYARAVLALTQPPEWSQPPSK